MLTSVELYAKVDSLDALADDVEVCVDAAKAVADSPDGECSNATEVRGALTGWRSAARSSPANLRDEASRVRGEARGAAVREGEAREQARPEAERTRTGSPAR